MSLTPRALTSARILVIDDQESNLLLLDRILRHKGFTAIETLADSRRAVERFRAFRPDLVCLDLRMPHVSGLEVLEALQPHSAGADYVPVLILTAETSPDARQKALSMGAKDFLNKPFDRVEALLRIQNLLETRMLYLELRGQNERLDQKVRERTHELEEAQQEILARLALASEYRDDETGEHTRRVGHLAALLARELGLSEEEVELIRLAAPLHDIGKIGIPDAVLMKAGRLTPEELTLMKAHTDIGARLLSGSRFPLLRLAQEIARTHHENWDGSGYAGLRGAEIPLASRIVAVADAFDALTNDRPYRPATTIRKAVEEIQREAGRQFDPDVVDALVRVLESEAGFSAGAERQLESPEPR
ncbi:MAG TPA: HD domain-containing phosphohydrolase [Vicinamibacterales bacterium]